MTKLVSIITTAAIAGTMAMAGAMSSFAAEEAAGAEIQQSIQEAQTEIPESSSATEEAPQEQTEAPVAAEAVDVPAAETKAAAPPAMSQEEAEQLAVAEAEKNGIKAIATGAEFDADNGWWNIRLQHYEGTKVYFSHVSESAVTLIDPEAAETAPAPAETATTVTAATATSATQTTATTAASTKPADKSSSPKTGVAAPSLPAAGIVLAFAAVVLTLKRKKN